MISIDIQRKGRKWGKFDLKTKGERNFKDNDLFQLTWHEFQTSIIDLRWKKKMISLRTAEKGKKRWLKEKSALNLIKSDVKWLAQAPAIPEVIYYILTIPS